MQFCFQLIIVANCRPELHAICLPLIQDVTWISRFKFVTFPQVYRAIPYTVKGLHHSVELGLTVLPFNYANLRCVVCSRKKCDFLLIHRSYLIV